MFAIQNKITGQWVYGTNYRFSPPRQRISNRQALTYEERSYAESDFQTRRCNKDYAVVEVTLNIIKDVSE